MTDFAPGRRLILSVLVAMALLGGCREHEARRHGVTPAPVTVSATAVTAKQRIATEEITGTIEAKLRATIEAKVSGRIIALAVVAGQSVRTNDLLLRLDGREIGARLDQARARLEQAERDRRRFANLLQQQSATQRQYDDAETQHRIALAAVTEAETMFESTVITAPFDGVISSKLVDIGDLAVPGKPLLILEDPRTLQVTAYVAETLVDRLRVGDALTVNTGTESVPIEATIGEIAPTADPASRTVRLKLDLPPNNAVRLGQFVRVAVPVGNVNALRVPATAVLLRGQLEMVFVVDGGTARMRLVRSGKRVGDEIEILSGLTDGEVVVIEGTSVLADGQPVSIR